MNEQVSKVKEELVWEPVAGRSGVYILKNDLPPRTVDDLSPEMQAELQKLIEQYEARKRELASMGSKKIEDLSELFGNTANL